MALNYDEAEFEITVLNSEKYNEITFSEYNLVFALITVYNPAM